ncbi:MAG: hypothetical protein CFE43_21805, partial [Burkholderiales bacterium PBB3]
MIYENVNNSLLEYLAKHTELKLPMFVFVDELDRCRPDYAVRLLEGLKHLFDAQGVCFVVSTNLTQLSESVRAVYGSGFDGYRYLKRFFEFQYVMPEPDNLSFAKGLFEKSFLRSYKGKLFTGLPSMNGKPPPTMADTFAKIADAFEMDLRSQNQVFQLVEASLVEMSRFEEIYFFHLCFLAVVWHYDRTSFDALSSSKVHTKEEHRALYAKTPFLDASIPHKRHDASGWKSVESSVSEMAFNYYRFSLKTMEDIAKSYDPSETGKKYPDRVGCELAESARALNFRAGQMSPLGVCAAEYSWPLQSLNFSSSMQYEVADCDFPAFPFSSALFEA